MPRIYVLAGVNGAGKSSVGGKSLRLSGSNYFNPDEAAAAISAESGCSLDEANVRAWTEGKERLEKAIRERSNFTFETTLGANTIPRLLRQAADEGFDVRVWFVGLASAEQHLARVRARVASGGHDIPEEKIRERWDGSRRNIIRLMPHLTELRVYDNSAERDPETGDNPPPRLLLHWKQGSIAGPSDLENTPEWAKPIVAAALALRPRN
jgi:predicted ABC-type ATPase